MASKAHDRPGLPSRAGSAAAEPAGMDRIACVPWRSMAAQRDAWDDLARRAAEPNPFFESWYLLPSLEHLAGTGRVAVLRFEHEGRLAGLLPLVRAGRYYRWPLPHLSSWLHSNCFCGVPLVAQGAQEPFWQAVLQWADAAAGTALFLHMRGMVLNGPVCAALRQVAAGQARQVEVVQCEQRAMLASPLSPAAYLEASLSGRKRKELRRQAARLAEEGALSFERRHDAADVAAWCEAFLALEAKGWKGRAGSALASDAGTARLFRASLEEAAARGRLERLALTLDGRPIAMLATFLAAPGAYSYKTAFDEAYARFSPGVLLQRENLSILESDDIAWSDSCASADHPMIDHLWRERRSLGRLSIAIGGRLRRGAFRRLVGAETARRPATQR
ncbi:GNAT family N-acetyltransferase [Novosphingobium soli]|uniref:GNAT family N-acetyltransferase n=1 Tax=Novosphingobium soli TaxID=574956 RepID=A0ABV6CQL8_9SPHN